ncbi:hypothetical protein V2G26_011142 [Clonostachys chloroleuca]
MRRYAAFLNRFFLQGEITGSAFTGAQISARRRLEAMKVKSGIALERQQQLFAAISQEASSARQRWQDQVLLDQILALRTAAAAQIISAHAIISDEEMVDDLPSQTVPDEVPDFELLAEESLSGRDIHE